MGKGGLTTAIFVVLLFVLYIGIFSLTGEVVREGCTDTDGGRDYYSFGYVYKHEGIIFPDKCFQNRVREAYCLEDRISHRYYTCPNGCLDGKCLDRLYKCSDSDDNNYYTAGFVTKYPEGRFEDYCVLDKFLVEYRCRNNDISKIWYTCPYGCKKGRCLEE